MRCFALPALALLLAPPAFATAPPSPTLDQAQAAMDQRFDQAIADRPVSASSALVAEAFRPRLQALSGCLPAAAAAPGSVDCIVTAQAGPEPVYRLLRFRMEHAQWTLGLDSRQLRVPAPSLERAQVLLRQQLATRAGAEADAQTRAALHAAARSAQVLEVHGCDVGDDAPVIECEIAAAAGDERGQQTLAFSWVDGEWQNATP